MTPDLETLRTLVEVVGRGSYTAAAAHLGVAKSVASRRIAALERGLGTELLMRSTRALRPTEAGERLVAHARELLRALEDVCDEVAGQGSEPAGLLRLTAPSSLERALIAPVLAWLMQQHPRLSFQVLLAEERIDLMDHGIDLAIRGGRPDDSRLEVHPLAPVVGLVCASPAYLQRHGCPQAPADLGRHSCLHHAQVPNGGWNFASGEPLPPECAQRRLQVNSFRSLLDLAADGLGLAVLPPFMAQVALGAGTLQTVLHAHPLIGYPVWAAHLPMRHRPRKLDVTLEALLRYGRRPPAQWGEPMEPPRRPAAQPRARNKARR